MFSPDTIDTNSSETLAQPEEPCLRSVHTDRFGEVKARAEKLNKRAVKLGAEPIRLVVARVEERKIYDRETGRVLKDYYGNFITRSWTVFSIEGARPKSDGWSLVARFDHSAALGAPIIKSVPGIGELSTDFRTNERTQVCEHCKSKRRRKDTFLVRHEDGREMVVGRQCIADFLGHNLAKLVPVCEGIIGFCDELDGYCGSRTDLPVSLHGFLTVVTAMIRKTGYVSKAMSRDRGGMSTADSAWSLLNSPVLKPEDREFLAEAQEFAGQAETVIAWARTTYEIPKSDFEHNMMLATRVEGNLPATISGVAAYLPMAWMKANEEQVKKQAKVPSNYVGNVGDKIEIQVTYVGCASFDTQYGTTHIHRFQDTTGNLLVWKTSSSLYTSANKEVTEGMVLKLRGTIKEHSEYKGTKQTSILRVKVEAVG